MSKKKTKIGKAATRHQFSHLEKTSVKKVVSSEATHLDKEVLPDIAPVNGLGNLIFKDLRYTAILIGLVVLFILVLGGIFHYTPLANNLLSRFNIKY